MYFRLLVLGCRRAFAVYLVILGAVFLQPEAVLPQKAVAAEKGSGSIVLPEMPTGLSQEDALRFVAGLSDPDARLMLLRELENKRLAADAGHGPGFGGLITGYRVAVQNESRMLEERLSAAGAGLAETPAAIARIFGAVGSGQGGHGFGVTMLLTGLALAIGWLASWAVSVGTRPFREQLVTHSGRGFFERASRLAARGVLDLLIAVAFTAAGFLVIALTLPGDSLAHAFAATYVVAVTVIQVSMAMSRFVLAPMRPELRLLGLSDEIAKLSHRSVRAAASIGALAWTTTGFLILHGDPNPDVTLALVLMTGALVFGTFVWLVWRAREPVRQRLGDMMARDMASAGANGAVSAPAAKAIATLFQNWHRIVIAYLAIAWLLWARGIALTGESLIWPIMASLGVVALVPLVDRVLGRAIQGFVGALVVDAYATTVTTAGGEENGAVAELVDTTDDQRRYTRIIHRWCRVALGVLVVIALTSLWGVDVLAAMGAPGVTALWEAVFEIGAVALVAYILWQISEAALTRRTVHAAAPDIAEGAGTGEEEIIRSDDAGVMARAQTLLPLIRKFILMVLTVMVVMIGLSSLGVNIGPLLAGAGVIGLAIGFGAQTLVRDVVSGVFFLIDDAFRVGEYIEMGDIRGEVERISIRSLRLRHHRGAIHTIPFGELRHITNYNRDWVIYKMPMRVAPDTNPAQVKKIIKRIGTEMMADPELAPKMIEPLKSQGVFAIDDDSALVFRVKFMSKPREQFVLRREAYHRIQKAFADAGIAFARKQVEVVVPDTQASVASTSPTALAPAVAAAAGLQAIDPATSPAGASDTR